MRAKGDRGQPEQSSTRPEDPTLQAQVHFEWVKSEANIADLPSRGHFELLHDFGSRPVELKIPPISDWLSPAEAARAAGGGFGRERGGRRGR